MPQFYERGPSQLYLLPLDIRDWVPEDDLAHFVLEAVERVPMSSFQVNERGTGSAQWRPRMMPTLLIYCFANGIFRTGIGGCLGEPVGSGASCEYLCKRP